MHWLVKSRCTSWSSQDVKLVSKNEKTKEKIVNFELGNEAHKLCYVNMTSVLKRNFLVRVICAILIAVAKVMATILKYYQNTKAL